MTIRKLAWGALVAFAVLPGCGGTTIILPSSTTTVSQTTTVTNPGPVNPSPSPSPGQGAIDHVAIFNVGGESREVGTPTCDSLDPHIIHVGCKEWLTCTPKKADGSDVPSGEHPVKPDLFEATDGASLVRISDVHPDSNPFNILVIGLHAGDAVIDCQVSGVRSRNKFPIRVIP